MAKKHTAKFTEFTNEDQWIKGTCMGHTFSAKLFDTGSEYGINEGRVSKLEVKNPAGQTILNYDRGWDIENDEATNDVFTTIMDLLENAPIRFLEVYPADVIWQGIQSNSKEFSDADRTRLVSIHTLVKNGMLEQARRKIGESSATVRFYTLVPED